VAPGITKLTACAGGLSVRYFDGSALNFSAHGAQQK
jgi:hypothetical protein